MNAIVDGTKVGCGADGYQGIRVCISIYDDLFVYTRVMVFFRLLLPVRFLNYLGIHVYTRVVIFYGLLLCGTLPRSTMDCLHCQGPIKSGRADRKFCSDLCKNEYHNAQKFREHAEIKKINLTL